MPACSLYEPEENFLEETPMDRPWESCEEVYSEPYDPDEDDEYDLESDLIDELTREE